MKRIEVAMRLRPFCRLPGTACLIPYSPWQVEAFPALLRFKNLETGNGHELELGTKGPVLDFTVELDLEKGCVVIFGHSERGYQRFSIGMEEGGIRIVSEKGKHKMVLPADGFIRSETKERLSLGSHKILDWELVRRRRDLTEIFPVWFRLGQMVPEIGLKNEGTATLLKSCGKLEVGAQFTKLFMAGFHGILAPRLVDSDHQGIVEDKKASGCPLGLLWEGSKFIRALFFREESGGFAFLPFLPPAFHAGRMVNIATSKGDAIDLEWSKKLLRRAVIRPGSTRLASFSFQRSIKSFRENGERRNADVPLMLEKGKTVYLDRFES
jgi:hypothetical protein